MNWKGSDVEHMDLINKNYGKDFQKHLLEQYKLFVETSLDLTSKRLEANKFHLTLNSVVFGFVSYLTFMNQYVVMILFSIIGILTSVVWINIILSFKELNEAKFKVIHELERHLPALLFKYEENCYLGKYHGLTAYEKYYPIIFIILYIGLIVIASLEGYIIPFLN